MTKRLQERRTHSHCSRLLAFDRFGLILKRAVLVLPGLSATYFLMEVTILSTLRAISIFKSGWWRWFQLPGKSFATRLMMRA